MNASHSSPKPTRSKPAKPYPNFPRFATAVETDLGPRGRCSLTAARIISSSASPRLNFTASHPFTFAGWFRCLNQAGCIVSLRKNNEEGAVIDIEIDRSGRIAALVREDHGERGMPAQITGGRANDGQWHHFALTRNAGNLIELFLDGTSQGRATGANAGGPITTDLRALGSERYWVLHHQSNYGVPYLAGAVDEFCVFDRELSKAEIEDLAGHAR
jgi:Concanavalin A-like lectin/glucanases superfamily